MHKYLKAIGFSVLNKNDDLEVLLTDIVNKYDRKKVAFTDDGRQFVEFTKEYSADTGIKVCGEYIKNDEFRMEYYFPYLNGSQISSTEEIIIERKSDKEAYICACDDMRLGITLIFHLINTGDYLEAKNKKLDDRHIAAVSLSALSNEGKIILPVLHSENHVMERQKKVQKRTALIMAARNGDEEAIENLTADDMNTFNEVSDRAKNEDLYSIVDNCFMPYGFGTDIYSIIADIEGFEESVNSYTGEELCKLNLSCNDVNIDVCINKKDLLGEPAVGRRFKGIIWLQGEVMYR